MSKKIGLIVNPIAGMGGKVGLKGTDGPEIVEKARELGAEPVAPKRCIEALEKLKESKLNLEILTCSNEMGEEEAENVGFKPKIILEINSGETYPEDTKKAAEIFLERKVDLILFAGGDGTASDIYEVVGQEVPILGIPTGVKMHSALFANNPEIAARLVESYFSDDVSLEEAEVMDVDEEAFRRNELDTDLIGYARTLCHPKWIQAPKSPTAASGSEEENQKLIAKWVTKNMEKDRLYILGPGTTTQAVANLLGFDDSTLLGVDLIRNEEIIAKDVTEDRILKELEVSPGTIIVSPIGKQGFILGRGNQQISPEVIRKVGVDNIMILGTSNKLAKTPVLKVDTGDPDLDERFRGYVNVIFRYGLTRPVPVI